MRDIAALAARLRSHSASNPTPSGSKELETLRQENALLKRKYQKALEMLTKYKYELESQLGIPPKHPSRVQPPPAPTNDDLDIHFSTDDEDDGEPPNRNIESRKELLKRYLELHGRRRKTPPLPMEMTGGTENESPNFRESLDLAQSLNGSKTISKPPLRIPLHERFLQASTFPTN